MAEKLSADALERAAASLGGDWEISADDHIKLTLKLKGFASACQHANLAAFISEQLNHHADISFGWGYCRLSITTHDVGGLSQLDFDFAARFDAARASEPK